LSSLGALGGRSGYLPLHLDIVVPHFDFVIRQLAGASSAREFSTQRLVKRRSLDLVVWSPVAFMDFLALLVHMVQVRAVVLGALGVSRVFDLAFC